MKLELKHLAPYLPYGLKWVIEGDDVVYEVSGLDIRTFGVHLISDDDFGRCTLENGKPILRPLSSMTKEEAKEFSMLALLDFIGDDSTLLDLSVKTDKVSGTTISCSFSEIMFNHIHAKTTYSICVCGDFIKIVDKETDQVVSVSYSLYEWLFKNHFDVFGLIGDNLAIEKRDEQF